MTKPENKSSTSQLKQHPSHSLSKIVDPNGEKRSTVIAAVVSLTQLHMSCHAANSDHRDMTPEDQSDDVTCEPRPGCCG
jgi:hypothetical protein